MARLTGAGISSLGSQSLRPPKNYASWIWSQKRRVPFRLLLLSAYCTSTELDKSFWLDTWSVRFTMELSTPFLPDVLRHLVQGSAREAGIPDSSRQTHDVTDKFCVAQA